MRQAARRIENPQSVAAAALRPQPKLLHVEDANPLSAGGPSVSRIIGMSPSMGYPGSSAAGRTRIPTASKPAALTNSGRIDGRMLAVTVEAQGSSPGRSVPGPKEISL